MRKEFFPIKAVLESEQDPVKKIELEEFEEPHQYLYLEFENHEGNIGYLKIGISSLIYKKGHICPPK